MTYNYDGSINWTDHLDPFAYETVNFPNFFDLNVTTTPRIPQIPHTPHIGLGYPVREEEPQVQIFFEGPKKCDCCVNWIEKPPVQMPEHAKVKYGKAAIVVFKAKDHKAEKAVVGGLIAMRTHSVEIQSPIIIELLNPILRDLGRLTPEKDKIKVSAPFRELFFAHPKVTALRDEQNGDSANRRHLDVLLEVMDSLFSDITTEVTNLHVKKMITWKYLWTIFPKNIIVYSRRNGQDRLYQIVNTEGGDYSRWQLLCRYHQFDGTSFGKAQITIDVPKFNGARLISSLPVYPIGFHDDPKLETKIHERSRKVLAFQDISHCQYDGTAILATDKYRMQEQGDEEEEDEYSKTRPSPTKRSHVSGRVLIDAFGMSRFRPNEHIEVEPIEFLTNENDESEAQSSQKVSLPLSYLDAHSKRRPTAAEQRLAREIMLDKRESLLILSPLLPGYSLNLNQWFWFSIDKLRPVTWSLEAFEHLVLPDGQKELLLNYVKMHARASKLSDDIIAGKGQGLVFLLSGPSGTGKTLTAEALAEVTKRPLLRLQASSFRTSYEARGLLTTAFELSEEWNALMLIDGTPKKCVWNEELNSALEADDFISERSREGNASYEVPSGILRHIEYFRGIICLTANLFRKVDDAFRTRIHVHLCYNTLPPESRRMLWEIFIQRLHVTSPTSTPTAAGVSPTDISIDLSPEDWDELSLWELNGRDIKNIVKTVYLDCIHSGRALTLARVEEGIKIKSPFTEKSGTLVDVTHAPNKRRRMHE